MIKKEFLNKVLGKRGDHPVEKEVLKFDTMGIQECQRNRYPLLFIDRVEEAVPM